MLGEACNATGDVEDMSVGQELAEHFSCMQLSAIVFKIALYLSCLTTTVERLQLLLLTRRVGSLVH